MRTRTLTQAYTHTHVPRYKHTNKCKHTSTHVHVPIHAHTHTQGLSVFPRFTFDTYRVRFCIATFWVSTINPPPPEPSFAESVSLLSSHLRPLFCKRLQEIAQACETLSALLQSHVAAGTKPSSLKCVPQGRCAWSFCRTSPAKMPSTL